MSVYEGWMPQALAAPIFSGLTSDEVRRVGTCLGVSVRSFQQGDTLARSGHAQLSVGLVLSGAVFTNTLEHDGTRHLVGSVTAGDVYGEDLLASTEGRTTHSVTAATPGNALVIGMGKILHAPGPLCALRSRVVENLLHIMATKNGALQSKLALVATKSMRDRVVLFLQEQQELHGSRRFTILFSRAELADFLCVDRAALSRELMRMKSAGLIDVHRNSFAILAPL